MKTTTQITNTTTTERKPVKHPSALVSRLFHSFYPLVIANYRLHVTENLALLTVLPLLLPLTPQKTRLVSPSPPSSSLSYVQTRKRQLTLSANNRPVTQDLVVSDVSAEEPKHLAIAADTNRSEIMSPCASQTYLLDPPDSNVYFRRFRERPATKRILLLAKGRPSKLRHPPPKSRRHTRHTRQTITNLLSSSSTRKKAQFRANKFILNIIATSAGPGGPLAAPTS